MKFRLTFVSNSSSTSFVIPKECLSKEDLELYRSHMMMGEDYCGDQHLLETKDYIHGEVSYHNEELNTMFEKYYECKGVQYDY